MVQSDESRLLDESWKSLNSQFKEITGINYLLKKEKPENKYIKFFESLKGETIFLERDYYKFLAPLLYWSGVKATFDKAEESIKMFDEKSLDAAAEYSKKERKRFLFNANDFVCTAIRVMVLPRRIPYTPCQQNTNEKFGKYLILIP